MREQPGNPRADQYTELTDPQLRPGRVKRDLSFAASDLLALKQQRMLQMLIASEAR